MPTNSVKGFKVGNEVKKYDYNELDNLPENNPDDLAEEVNDLKSDLTTTKNSIDNGIVTIDKTLYEQGGWSEQGEKYNASRIVRVATPYKVRKGDVIYYDPSALYVRWIIIDSIGNVVEQYPFSANWSNDSVDVELQHDGMLYITVRNGYNEGNSQSIVPSDVSFDFSIKYESFSANDKIAEIIGELGIPMDKFVNLRKGVNVVNNGTEYVTAGTYETFFASVVSGRNYKIKIKKIANTSARLAFSASIPKSGVSCTFIEEKQITSDAEFDYTATADGFISVSAYHDQISIDSVVEMTDGTLADVSDIPLVNVIKKAVFDYDIAENISVKKLNIPIRGSSYSANNSYRTYYFPVIKGITYYVTVENPTGTAQYYRISRCNEEPANGVSAVFLQEVEHSEALFTLSVDADYDGYIGITSWYSNIGSISVFNKGIIERIVSLEQETPNPLNYPKTFEGEAILTKKQRYKTYSYLFDPIRPAEEIPQDIAYYDGTLFTVFNGVKMIVMQDMETGAEIGRPQNNLIGHANDIIFSNEFYSEDDDYPLLYVSPEDGGYLRAFRITPQSLTLVKTYLVDTSVTGYYTGFCLDKVNSLLYSFGYTENSYNTNPSGTNYMIMCCFDLKNTTTDVEQNLIPQMLYKKTLPFIMTHQGNTFYNNRIWMVSSDYDYHNTNVYVISPDGIITNIIGDFDSNIKDKECEGIMFYSDNDKHRMMLLTGDNKLHVVEFMN